MVAQEMLEHAIFVSDCRWDEFTKRFASVVRRAAKLGVEAPTFEVGKRTRVKVQSGFDIGQEVRILGPIPRVDGWSVAAIIEREDGVIVSFREGVPVEFRRPDYTRCDHCNTRRQRGKVVVLTNDAGEFIQVGATCLKDFCGGRMVGSMTVAELISGFAEENWGYGTVNAWDLELALAATLMEIEATGRYISRRQAQESLSGSILSTADAVSIILMERIGEVVDRLPEFRERVEKIIAWAKEQEDSPNDFLYNLAQLANAEVVRFKRIGLASAMVAAYQRHVEKQEARSVEAKSEHVGTVGKRSTFQVTIVKQFCVETQFGLSTRYMMRDENGNVLGWWASRPQGWEVGDEMTVVGTVKAHTEYKGIKITELSRVKKV